MIPRVPVEGGPGWINSDFYYIDAKSDAPETQGMMRGPMLQALLEDRFQLRIHRETRDVPVYALTVAKGGPKLPRTVEGSCIPFDRTRRPPDGKPWCALTRSVRKGPNLTWEARSLTLAAFSKTLGLDRPVIDKTGIAGVFDFHLDFAPDDTSASRHPDGGAADPAGGPSLFTALQEQLGLRLDPTRGPAEFLVIDRVERPSGN
jgi:uncharacterized protein (TIGR03435 family)